jgi:hypothetical protein
MKSSKPKYPQASGRGKLNRSKREEGRTELEEAWDAAAIARYYPSRTADTQLKSIPLREVMLPVTSER